MGILTEEELIKDIIRKLDWPTYPESSHHRYNLEQLEKSIKASKESYLSANADLTERKRLLVLENDELLAENEKFKRAIKILQIALEELK